MLWMWERKAGKSLAAKIKINLSTIDCTPSIDVSIVFVVVVFGKSTTKSISVKQFECDWIIKLIRLNIYQANGPCANTNPKTSNNDSTRIRSIRQHVVALCRQQRFFFRNHRCAPRSRLLLSSERTEHKNTLTHWMRTAHTEWKMCAASVVVRFVCVLRSIQFVNSFNTRRSHIFTARAKFVFAFQKFRKKKKNKTEQKKWNNNEREEM